MTAEIVCVSTFSLSIISIIIIIHIQIRRHYFEKISHVVT